MGRQRVHTCALPAFDEPPEGLRSTKLLVGDCEYVILSYPASDRGVIAKLSRAESEVLRAALDGLANEEIAAIRHRSVFTIQNQLASAYRKLGVTSRTEAALRLASVEQSTSAIPGAEE